MLAALENELVHRRQAVSRENLLATYALGRLVPSGTMTALAVAYGYRFGGWTGSVLAVAALVLPSTVLTLVLTLAFETLQGGVAVEMLSATVLPAALAFVVVAALRFGKDVYRLSPDLAIAASVWCASLVLDLHPAVLLLGGGLAGLVACHRR
jgi:chromate transporter